ncbi:MAG: cadherin-like domain-containing protein [Devosia sp.]|nr:cadherin-like domain-containing protein [Devosia sp.]MCR6633535.1 cadherin-like domain-containing protein [Devosia sp.]MCR6636655.1 cadherin-like domain-containing protein [Devosia sp.]
MIIEAKSSQQQHQKSDPADLRKKLEFNVPEKTSRLPVYLALFFTGIAAYVKSVFPADAQDHVSPGTEANPAANSGAPRGTRHEPGGPGVDLMTTGGIEEEHPRSSVRHAALGWDEAFTMPDPIAFHYTAASFDFLGPNVAPFFPAAVHYRPQNDNAALFDRAEPNITPSSSGPKPHQDTPSPSEDDGDNDNADPDDDDEDDDDDNGTNRAPTVLGPVRLHDVFAGQVVLIGLSQLLFGASDPDNDILTINDLTVTGATLVQTGAGWTLTTLPGMLGLVTFTYEISDGLIEIVQTASLEIVRNQVHLTANADVYAGTPGTTTSTLCPAMTSSTPAPAMTASPAGSATTTSLAGTATTPSLATRAMTSSSAARATTPSAAAPAMTCSSAKPAMTSSMATKATTPSRVAPVTTSSMAAKATMPSLPAQATTMSMAARVLTRSTIPRAPTTSSSTSSPASPPATAWARTRSKTWKRPLAAAAMTPSSSAPRPRSSPAGAATTSSSSP